MRHAYCCHDEVIKPQEVKYNPLYKLYLGFFFHQAEEEVEYSDVKHVRKTSRKVIVNYLKYKRHKYIQIEFSIS